MSGAGRMVFQPGAVLTASQVQNYLQDQAVQYYAGTAARGSAIGTATTEGMMSYLADTDKLQLATGTATWVDVYPPINTAGNVVQVAQAFKQDTFTTSGTAWVDVTGMSVSITPSSTANKILVRVFGYMRGQATVVTARARLVDGSNNIIAGSTVVGSRTSGIICMTSSTADDNTGVVMEYLHSPGSVSSQTYKLQLSADNANTVYWNRSVSDGNSASTVRGVSSITVMEIAG